MLTAADIPIRFSADNHASAAFQTPNAPIIGVVWLQGSSPVSDGGPSSAFSLRLRWAADMHECNGMQMGCRRLRRPDRGSGMPKDGDI